MNSTRAPTRTHMPGRAMALDDIGKARSKPFSPLFHMGVVFSRHHMGKVGLHRRKLQRVCGQASCRSPKTPPGAVGVVVVEAIWSLLRSHAPDRGWQATLPPASRPRTCRVQARACGYSRQGPKKSYGFRR